MKPTMIGPETGLSELARLIRWEVAYRRATLYDWFVQESDASRRAIVAEPVKFAEVFEALEGWRPDR